MERLNEFAGRQNFLISKYEDTVGNLYMVYDFILLADLIGASDLPDYEFMPISTFLDRSRGQDYKLIQVLALVLGINTFDMNREDFKTLRNYLSYEKIGQKLLGHLDGILEEMEKFPLDSLKAYGSLVDLYRRRLSSYQEERDRLYEIFENLEDHLERDCQLHREDFLRELGEFRAYEEGLEPRDFGDSLEDMVFKITSCLDRTSYEYYYNALVDLSTNIASQVFNKEISLEKLKTDFNPPSLGSLYEILGYREEAGDFYDRIYRSQIYTSILRLLSMFKGNLEDYGGQDLEDLVGASYYDLLNTSSFLSDRISKFKTYKFGSREFLSYNSKVYVYLEFKLMLAQIESLLEILSLGQKLDLEDPSLADQDLESQIPGLSLRSKNLIRSVVGRRDLSLGDLADFSQALTKEEVLDNPIIDEFILELDFVYKDLVETIEKSPEAREELGELEGLVAGRIGEVARAYPGIFKDLLGPEQGDQDFLLETSPRERIMNLEIEEIEDPSGPKEAR